MSELPNVDRQGTEIRVNAIVFYADGDRLLEGKVVYVAEPDTAELVIESPGVGLFIKDGRANDGYVVYKDVYVLP